MPNPGKPLSLKLISGSRRMSDASRSVRLPLIDGVPPAPEWLPNEHAIREWKRLAPILHANKLLTAPALSILGHACALHGKIAQTLASGQQPKAALLGVYRQLLNDFGLTPATRGKLSATASGNSFVRNGKRTLPGRKTDIAT